MLKLATSYSCAMSPDRTAAQWAENGLARHKTRRVFIVDDHPIARRGLRELLESSPGWQYCGHAATGESCLRMAPKLKPDVIIMDISMRGMGGFEATRAIRAALPEVRIILHTIHKTAELVRIGLAAGATGCVLKTDPEDQMLAALEAVMRGEVYVAPSFGAKAIAAVAKKTPRKKPASSGKPKYRRKRSAAY